MSYPLVYHKKGVGGAFLTKAPSIGCKKGRRGAIVLRGDIRRGKMSAVPAAVAIDHGDGFRLSMAEIARHVGVTTSSMAKVIAR